MHTTPEGARLDRMFFALADVNRRGMLSLLSRGPASVSELAEPLQIALPSAVKHLAVLEQGGFVASQKSGRVRTYAVDPEAFHAMEVWLARHKTVLNTQFDRLDAYLAAQKGKTK
ncbi:MAG: transcriptional regulator [Burkholderiales bacterium PBB3]|nr:MAG: transcriptional regulator [Burkholderiales bacterium PBB3]